MSEIAQAIANRQSEIDRLQAEIADALNNPAPVQKAEQ